MSKVVNAWTVYRNASSLYWGATAAQLGWGAGTFVATGGRSTLGFQRASQMISFGVRTHWNAARGVASTPLLRKGRMTIGKASGAILAGYAVGAAVGSSIAYAWKGKSGLRDALDLYSGGVGLGEYVSTVGGALKETLWDSWSL